MTIDKILRTGAAAVGLAAMLGCAMPRYVEARERSPPKVEKQKVDYKALIKKAKKLSAEKKYKEVIELMKPYEKEAKNWVFFNTLGYSYLNLKNYKSSLKGFKRAHELNPKATEPMLNLGVVYFNVRDFDNSRKFAIMYLENGGESKEVANALLRYCDKYGKKK